MVKPGCARYDDETNFGPTPYKETPFRNDLGPKYPSSGAGGALIRSFVRIPPAAGWQHGIPCTQDAEDRGAVGEHTRAEKRHVSRAMAATRAWAHARAQRNRRRKRPRDGRVRCFNEQSPQLVSSTRAERHTTQGAPGPMPIRRQARQDEPYRNLNSRVAANVPLSRGTASSRRRCEPLPNRKCLL